MSLDRFPEGSAVFEAGSADSGRLAQAMADHAEPAASFLKALGHEGRLMILCHLAGGEKSVTELEGLLGQRQAAVSQQLARLRLEGMVTTRREGKVIHYALHDPRLVPLLASLPGLFTQGA